jgi:hypothetical protein
MDVAFAIANNRVITTDYIAWNMAYGTLYILGVLWLATFILRRRDLY